MTTSRILFCRTNSLNNMQYITFIIDAILYWIKMIIIFLWLTYKSWIEKETENFNVFDDAIRSSQCEVKWYITDDQHEFHGLKMIINFYRKYFSIPSNGNSCLSYMRKVMRPRYQREPGTFTLSIILWGPPLEKVLGTSCLSFEVTQKGGPSGENVKS